MSDLDPTSTPHYYFFDTKSFLSNTYECEYVLDNIVFNSVQQGFMYSKALLFNDTVMADKILKTPYTKTGYVLMGSRVKNFNEKYWNRHKNKLMYSHVFQKFLQNSDLRKGLLDTNNYILVNATRNYIWGIGTTIRDVNLKSVHSWGMNLLGHILTNIRNTIKTSLSSKFLRKTSGTLITDVKTSKTPLENFNPVETDWDYYVGSKYFRIFTKIKLPKNGTVIEVGPGSMTKVGEGLKQYEFTGTLIIIEPEPKSLDEVYNKYCLMLPDVKIVKLNITLEDYLTIYDKNPTTIDLCVANHILDDMIIGKYITSNMEFSRFFENHYDEPDIDITAKLWES